MVVNSFGPIGLNKESSTYGYITSTLGEVSYGTLRGLRSGMYVIIGTGIGRGIWSEG